MLDTLPVNIVREGTMANVTLSSSEGRDIEKGQKVFLFREDGVLLDTLGEVTAVEQGSDTTHVRINILHNTEIPLEKIAKGKIIVNREKDVPRLPYSSLIRNEKAETYIWEVEENSDGTHTAHYRQANVTGGNDVVFIIGQNMATSNVFILNPDGALRDGQKINVRKYMYKPPSQNEDQRIMALVTRRNSELVSAARGIDNANRRPSGGGAVSADGIVMAGCPQPANATQSFIDKIKVLSTKAANKPAAPSP